MNKSESRPKEKNYLRDPFIGFCLVVVLGGLGTFGVWAATAPLAQGVTAPGTLIVEDRRRTVQHLEGGIIEELFIREGQDVRAGEPAMVISDANAVARFKQATAERHRLLAEIDRYDAQIANEPELVFLRLNAEDVDPVMRSELESTNLQLFFDETAAVAGQRELARARIARLRAEADALDVRRAGKEREIETLLSEQSVQNEALSQRLGNVSRVNEVNRLLAITETELSNLDEQERVIERSIGEAEVELRQVDLTDRARLSAARANALGELAAITDELAALGDRMARRHVTSPIDGVVIDLAYTAVGGVVAPGDAIFDLVPSTTTYLVDVRFQPQDRDDLAEGRPVNLRFGTLDPIIPPEVPGLLERIAADATFDAQTETYFYTAEVSIPESSLAALDDFEISPGIPVEVFFDKGLPRTPLSYFIEPVMVMIRLGMRA